METYKHPPSIKYIPRIFSWLLVFVLLFGVSKLRMPMMQNLSSGFKFHSGQMTGLCVQLTFLMQLAIGMLQMPITHSVKDSTGKTHLGLMQMV